MLCEIASAARRVLAHHLSDVECHPDVTELDHLPGDADVLVAGFPCQDLSQAGLTAGINGERSGLVRHVFRLLDDRALPWVVLENVSFMLHLGRGKALQVFTKALEDRGYRWAYRIVNSLAFEAGLQVVLYLRSVESIFGYLGQRLIPLRPGTLLVVAGRSVE